MMRSLFAGVAGLKTHQTRMDVIGNNIANVNTTAYKSQSMTFSDLMYQTTQAASGANAATGVGGTNARQIGLGSKTGAIKTAIGTQGATQTTNDPFDVMITGDAFFVVSNGAENFFTRDGSFYIDGAGNLAMTSTGYNVMGWQVDNAGQIKKDTVSALRIMNGENMTYPAEATTKATVSGIVDSKDTDVNGASGSVMNLDFYDNRGYKYTAKMSVHAVPGKGDNGEFYVQLDDILDSEGKSVVTKDNAGKFTDTTFGAAITLPAVPPATTGDTVQNAVYLTYSNVDGAFKGVGSSNTVTDKKITIGFDGGAHPSFADIVVDFSTTSNTNKGGTSTINAARGDQVGEIKGDGAGRLTGDMSDIEIQKDGKIYAYYTNGMNRLLGQIAVASFANPSGLAKEGDNLYSATQNSGEFNGVGEDILAGGGYMTSGVLEMSNVDLSSEFTEMITTQRGFQANSRIITVSDTLLEELTNLKR